jgi:UDP:flavonoid glycosyltransferase YjiC (YdhE family)
MTLAADALTAADIGASVDALLTDPKYRERARAIAVELRAAPPASAMLPFLEEVAHRRRVSV